MEDGDKRKNYEKIVLSDCFEKMRDKNVSWLRQEHWMQIDHQYKQYFFECRLRSQELLSQFLVLIVLALGVVGVFSPYDYNILPAVAILELAVLLLSAFVFPPKGRVSVFLMMSVVAYLLITFYVAVFLNNTNLLDYLQAYKAFIYVALLCSFIGKTFFSKVYVSKFFYILVVLFLVKYLYSRVVGLDVWVSSRPGVYTENNFELIFLLLLFYLVLPDLRWRTVFFLVVMAIVSLSGSRSAFLCLLVVYFFSVFRVGGFYWKKWLLLLPFLLFVGVFVVNDRMDVSLGNSSTAAEVQPAISPEASADIPGVTIEQDHEMTIRSFLEQGASVDRVRFLLLFLDNAEGWKWWNVLFGTEPLTPLSDETCRSLSYWSDLYSFSGDETCYSVILHSYIIRVIFDHGVMGLLFLIGFTAYGLRKSGYSWVDVLCVLGVLLASSLSVSAFNSVFAVLSMIFYFSRKEVPEDKNIGSGNSEFKSLGEN
ncbi:hypothetical protein [Halomonas sp. JB37]|uniref:hypothetical protein n=1 Tax=Halomonas sp. JB37 TaxID=2024405 RepID=UPI001143F196|nr:hypothetical protein [Halomonas sp. JB37]